MNNSSSGGYKRKFLVLKPFQLKLIVTLVLVTVVLILMSSIILYNSLDNVLTEAMFSSHIKAKTLSELYMPVVWQINTAFTLLLIIIVGMISAYMIARVKIALQGMRSGIKKIRGLNFSDKVYIYNNEAVADMVEAFNNMKSAIQGRLADVADAADNLKSLTQSLPSKDFDAEKAKKEIKRINEALSHFK